MTRRCLIRNLASLIVERPLLTAACTRVQDDSCDVVGVGMRCPIFYDWSRRCAEAYCEHSHDGYQGAYIKDTYRHLRKSSALLTSACFA
jgi:hypothetical protein